MQLMQNKSHGDSSRDMHSGPRDPLPPYLGQCGLVGRLQQLHGSKVEGSRLDVAFVEAIVVRCTERPCGVVRNGQVGSLQGGGQQ